MLKKIGKLENWKINDESSQKIWKLMMNHHKNLEIDDSQKFGN